MLLFKGIWPIMIMYSFVKKLCNIKKSKCMKSKYHITVAHLMTQHKLYFTVVQELLTQKRFSFRGIGKDILLEASRPYFSMCMNN